MDAELNEINASEESFTVGHNFMSTWTEAEYKKINGYTGLESEEDPLYLTLDSAKSESKDWRKEGAVNKIKDQSHCGSCWAFSATAAVEGAHFIKSGKLLSLSEQELVSCVTKSSGCNGGNKASAFEYLKSTKQELEVDYQYTSGSGSTGKCKVDRSKGKV